MGFRIKFTPRKYTINAQNLDSAYHEFLNTKITAFACSTYGVKANGSKYQVLCDDRTKTLYVYNVEVFKRGKHHKNKHYDFYLYSIPMSLLNIVKMDIKQHHRNFTVKML